MFSPVFYRCEHCGNLIWLVEDSSLPVSCCGEPVKRLTASVSDAGFEKHVPVAARYNDSLRVQIGSELHPSTEAHRIEWIALETDTGVLFKEVKEGKAPIAVFDLPAEKAIAVYAYCNLHGLWKTELR